MLSSCLISVPFNLQCLCISSMTPFLILLGTYTDITPGCPPGFPKSQNFNIRFQGANVWNDISDDLKLLSLKPFKKKLIKSQILLINIHCRFINTIFFLAFRCLIRHTQLSFPLCHGLKNILTIVGVNEASCMFFAFAIIISPVF